MFDKTRLPYVALDVLCVLLATEKGKECQKVDKILSNSCIRGLDWDPVVRLFLPVRG